MKLTRKQELALIDLGLKAVLRNYFDNVPVERGPYRKSEKRSPWNKGTTGKKWSKAQHAKFSETMKAKWADRNKKK